LRRKGKERVQMASYGCSISALPFSVEMPRVYPQPIQNLWVWMEFIPFYFLFK